MNDKKKAQLEIVNPEEVPTEILAEAIVAISHGVKKMLAGRLTRRAIVLLIQDACSQRVGKPAIEMVLDSMAELEKRYVRE